MAHFEEIKHEFLDGSIDILAVSESWLHQNVGDNLINAPGYVVKRLDRSVKNWNGSIKSGGGVCVFHRDHLQVTLNLAF